MVNSVQRPRIAVTLGDPRGIGPEVACAALADPDLAGAADFIVFGPEPAAVAFPISFGAHVEYRSTGPWTGGGEREAGEHSARAIEGGISMSLAHEVDGLVTAPIAKTALREAGYDVPGHTELLRERCAVPDVTMVMAAEETALGGPLRIALLTVHVPLRDVPGLLDVDLVVRARRSPPALSGTGGASIDRVLR